MTEEEAKKKWCPMVRKLTFRETSAFSGSHTPNNEEAKCIGSACMMWRATVEVIPGCTTNSGFAPAIANTTGGYCGLAGKP